MKMIRNMLLPIIAIITMLAPININAQNEIEKTQTGSIKIILQDIQNGSKEGVVFDLYRVAYFKDGVFDLVDDFKNTNIDLNHIKTTSELEKVSKSLSKVNATPNQTKVTDQNGTLIFNDLHVGAYLVKPINTANYEEINPFIISIPMYDEISGGMIYDVESYPKHSPIPQMPITSDNTNFKIAGSIFICIGLILLLIYIIKKKRQGF